MLGRQVLLKYDESIELLTNQGKAATLQVKTAASQTDSSCISTSRHGPKKQRNATPDPPHHPPHLQRRPSQTPWLTLYGFLSPALSADNGRQALMECRPFSSRLRGQVKNALISSSSTWACKAQRTSCRPDGAPVAQPAAILLPSLLQRAFFSPVAFQAGSSFTPCLMWCVHKAKEKGWRGWGWLGGGKTLGGVEVGVGRLISFPWY